MDESKLSKPEPRLLDRVRAAVADQGYGRRVEQAYVHWIRQFILFHRKRHPQAMGEPEVEAFLEHLTLARQASAATRNQALGAIQFLYADVLGRQLGWLPTPARALRPPRLLSRQEVASLLAQLEGVCWLMAAMLYGGGLRVQECVELRVKDIDLLRRQLIVRQGAGRPDRLTVLPEALLAPLQQHLAKVRQLHAGDLDAGLGAVELPVRMRRQPAAAREWGWQFVFPSRHLSAEPAQRARRPHMETRTLERAVSAAARQAGIDAPIGCHTLRRCFAAHLLDGGYDGETVRSLLGGGGLAGSGDPAQLLILGTAAVRSPLDGPVEAGAARAAAG